MATQVITLSVTPRGKPIGKLPSEVAVPRAAPSSEIYQKIAAVTGTSVHRLRVAKGSDGQVVPNERDVSVLDTGLRDGSRITVKDLGKFEELPDLAISTHKESDTAFSLQVPRSHGAPCF